MTKDNIIELSFVAGAVLLLAIKRKGMKKYIPAALFAAYWALVWCEFAEYFEWWEYPSMIFPYFDLSATANFVIVPIMAMFWIKYAPKGFEKLVIWALLSTIVLVGIEYFLERYTDLLEYGNEYEWYYSFILWFISWFAWYGFHVWFYDMTK